MFMPDSSKQIENTKKYNKKRKLQFWKCFIVGQFVAVELGNALQWTSVESSIRKVNGGPVKPAESKNLANYGAKVLWGFWLELELERLKV